MQVRIERLEPMRVASVSAYSTTPEADAWDALLAWAKGKGLLNGGMAYRLFGYDLPSQGENAPRGYRTWITLGPDFQCGPEESVQTQEFGGGLYAVTRCRLADIVDTWAKLHEWVKQSPYRIGRHQWLEEHLTLPQSPWQDVMLDLFHPIVG